MKKLLFIFILISATLTVSAQTNFVDLPTKSTTTSTDSFVVVNSAITYRMSYSNLVGNDIDNLQSSIDTLHVSNRWIVGEGSVYTTVQSAITAASLGSIIKIYEGTYNESITLKDGVNLLGVGDVVIDYDTDDSNYTIIASSDTCTIKNITIRRTRTGQLYGSINAVNSQLEFVDCKIGSNEDGIPLNMSGSIIRCVDTDIITLSAVNDSISIRGGSRLLIEGGEMTGSFNVRDSSELLASVNAWYVKSAGVTNDGMVRVFNDAEVDIDIRTIATTKSSTGVIDPEGGKVMFYLNHNAIGRLSGNEIRSQISCNGNSTLYMRNVSSSMGVSRVTGNDSATINIDNWYSIFDIDDQVTGSHNLETFTYTGEINISNSWIEFTGYSGKHETMGSPIVVSEGTVLKMYNTTVVDHDNDNSGGANYSAAIFGKSEVEMYDCTIKQINSDNLVSGKSVLTLNGTANWRVILNNVHFFSDISDGVGIYLATSYDDTQDTLILSGCDFDLTTPFDGFNSETFADITDFSIESDNKSYSMALNSKNAFIEDTITQGTLAYQSGATTAAVKGPYYKTALSNGVHGDNSTLIASDDTLAIVFHYNENVNDVSSKIWSAADGKILGGDYRASVETGKLHDFDFAALGDTAYHTVAQTYDFGAYGGVFTFTAGPATDTSYTVYVQCTFSCKYFAYFYDLMNIKEVEFVRIEED